MATVGIGEIRRHPRDVFQRVLATGQPLEVTHRGTPLGVQIVPGGSVARPWVKGAVLDQVPTPDAMDAEGMRSSIEEMRDAEPVLDPWSERD